MYQMPHLAHQTQKRSFIICVKCVKFLQYTTVPLHFWHGTDSNGICTLLVFLFIFLSHPTLSHSISTSSDPTFSPSSLSNHPFSSEGWVPMWVYFGVGSGVGQVTVWVVGMAAWWVVASWVMGSWVTVS